MSILFSFQVEGRGFRNTWLAVFQNIQQVKPVDATIGFTSLGVILLLRVRYIHLTISISWVTLITEFDTLWLSPGIIETAGSKLINGTLVDRGGSELQY